MSEKWKLPIKCPDCGSTAVRRREIVHKSGTSEYSGSSSTKGVSFGVSGKSKPRFWLGGGSHRGTRQSILAKEAAPLSVWPAFVILTLILLFHNYDESFSPLAWFGFIFSGLWVLFSLVDGSSYKEEWACSKCGATFVPEKEDGNEESLVSESMTMKDENTKSIEKGTESGKACSICGNWFPHPEFSYGNKENRSYCQKCDKEEKRAYSKGGTEAARKYREDMRATWKKPNQ